MIPDIVIENYAIDVAMRLPLGQRKDVAAELCSLLKEELHAKAERLGSPATVEMAQGLIMDFGAPDEVAARYQTSDFVIVEPSQTRSFLWLAASVMALYWVGGIVKAVGALSDGAHALAVLQSWFFEAFLASFWWPGFLVALTAFVNWRKFRAPEFDLQKGMPHMSSGTVSKWMWLVIPFAAAGTAFYAAPGWFFDIFAPAGFDTSWINYAEDFRSSRLYALVSYLAAGTILLIAVTLQGYWSRSSRLSAVAIDLLGMGVMAWCIMGGAMFEAKPTDDIVKLVLVVMIVIAALDAIGHGYRAILLSVRENLRPSDGA